MSVIFWQIMTIEDALGKICDEDGMEKSHPKFLLLMLELFLCL